VAIGLKAFAVDRDDDDLATCRTLKQLHPGIHEPVLDEVEAAGKIDGGNDPQRNQPGPDASAFRHQPIWAARRGVGRHHWPPLPLPPLLLPLLLLPLLPLPPLPLLLLPSLPLLPLPLLPLPLLPLPLLPLP